MLQKPTCGSMRTTSVSCLYPPPALLQNTQLLVADKAEARGGSRAALAALVQAMINQDAKAILRFKAAANRVSRDTEL